LTRTLALILALAGGTAAGGAPAAAPAPRQLVAGDTLTATLAAGEALVVEVEKGVGGGAPAGGAALLIDVEQLGIDVVLDVVAPDGAHLGPVDSPTDRDGPESLLIPADAAPGRYRVEVRAAAGALPAGRVAVHAEALLAASAGDRRRLAAESEMSAAGRLFAAGGAAARRAAAARLETALGLWRAAGDRRQEARALYWLAQIHDALGESRQALDLYGQALPLWQALGSAGREADAWTGKGLASWHLGDNESAISEFERALAIERQLGDRHRLAMTRNDLCLVHHSRGELRQALACYEDVLGGLHGQGEERQEAVLLLNAGAASASLGEPRLAITRYRQALGLLRAAGDRKQEAQALNNLAVVWNSLGEKGQALATYGQALDLFRQAGDRLGEARALNNIGVAYFALGEPARAVEHYDQALALRRELGDRRGEASTLTNLGAAYGAGGDPGKAVAAAGQALALARAVADRNGEADALALLGRELAAAGDLGGALARLGEAVAARRATGDRAGMAEALEQLGEVQAKLGDAASLAPAGAAVEQALAIRRDLGDPGGQIEALDALSRIERRRGRLPPALNHAEEALRLVESLRTAIAGPVLRASFLGARHSVYETAIELLMELDRGAPGQGHARRALEVSERARARALLDLLGEARSTARPDDRQPAEDADRRRQALDERLRAKHRRRLELSALAGSGADGPAAGERAAVERQAVEHEVQAVLREIDRLEIETRANRPRYLQLTEPRPLTAAQVQVLLDPGTLLLELALGEDQSYLWVVGSDSFDSFELPGRAAIEDQARRVYGHLHARSLDAAEAGEARRAAVGLSRLVLGAAAGRLGDRRLVVVADGALAYLPFAALPQPDDPDQPLLARHEVVSLPSASLLPLLRQGSGSRPAAGARRLLVLADPVFTAADPRVVGAGRAAAGGLDRLPATRREAETIAALLPAGAARMALDFDASRDLVLAGDLTPYRFVHFATHGVIDAQNPALSGLELASVGPDGAPRDGFLSLGDVYSLHLGADLVVLSGCETALGKAIRGEGLVGLVQGFLVAGAHRVLASLWRVPDRSTAELMGSFYRGLLVERLPAAAALRQAQLTLSRERRWRSPYFWASFVLLGDWR
jgi:tetratricopeptide (TPR) repeat protein